MSEAYKIHLGPASCAVDLGDGSERGEYVNQDYILERLGRPHRAINLMYCYYPLDKGWPERASKAHAHDNLNDVWDYPYDDYFPYGGGIGGSLEGEPFTFMRDVRRHGQDVCLTLTIDPFVSDEHLVAIAKDMAKFGRVTLRINHEATGNWFSFNKRASYEQVAAFFVHCCEIIHREAKNCQVVLCLDGCKDASEEKMVMEEIFTEAAKAADIVSVDRYMALHWGWPVDIAEPGGTTFGRSKVKDIYEMAKKSYNRYIVMNDGVIKPMVMSELNADGDVTGPYDQADMFTEFCELLKKDPERWLSGFTTYQFRDRGRLGLEIESPNNPEVGIEQPLLGAYKKIIRDDFFSPSQTLGEAVTLPQTLRWGSAEDSEGLAVSVQLEANPVFLEAYFVEELAEENLMLCINKRWFYKAPGVKCIDLSGAFFEHPLTGPATLQLAIYAPPATGENDPAQGEDWQTNYYREIKSLPKLRIHYKPIL